MLSLYNTLSKKKEEFLPLTDKRVKLYTCGPTVYDYVHIGNLRSYVMADTLRRVLEASDYTVHHVKNITDVGHLTADDVAQGDGGEDKMVKKALAENKTPKAIADFYTEYYLQAEAALNILPPQDQPRATEYIREMIAFIERLIASGHAYAVNGNVFFDVTSYAAYGKLSGNTLDQLKVGARLEEHPDKRNPWDFALWLRAPEGHLMRWESPWGVGYPGWHIECSAMNLATLGTTIDIHTGGEDNIFPHHEAEIAQSECGNSAPFARYWVHTRHLLIDGAKMAKSKGTAYRLEDILDRGFSSMDLRMLFLSAHYRSQMNFTWDALAQAKKNKETIFQAMRRVESLSESEGTLKALGGKELQETFDISLSDDLNTPGALAVILDFIKKMNRLLDENQPIDIESIQTAFKHTAFVFGLIPEAIALPENIQTLVEERKQARINKDFARSDALRDEITELGYIVEDGANGQTVRKK